MKPGKLIALAMLAAAGWLTGGPQAGTSPACAQEQRQDGARIAAEATDAASGLQSYLKGVLDSGGRPDLSKPPASDLLVRVFAPKRLAALPPVRGDDLPWLMDWIVAANTANKAIMLFGIPANVDPLANPGPLNRNVADFEDQLATAVDCILRLTAREMQAAVLFMDGLPPDQRTRIRVEGFNKARLASTQTALNDLGWIAAGMRPANSALVSAAFRDNAAVWATAVAPAHLPVLLATLDKAREGAKDEETRTNLSAFRAELTKAK